MGALALQDAARHVVIPEGIVSTGWGPVRAKCSDLGIVFDRWQDDAGRLFFAKRANGRYAATRGGCVLSIPRQVGKTFLVGWIVFAVCLLEPYSKVIWTSHHTSTTDETFESMKEMSELPSVSPFIDKVRSANGQQRLIFQNGSRIEFGARERGFGRGKKQVKILVLDEGQIMSESAMENLVPSMNRAHNPMLFIMGTPPRPQDPGEMFTNKRTRALSGLSKDALYVEFSADDEADIHDREQWAIANPSYPHHTDEDSILRMMENFGAAGFKREALGIWDKEIAGSNAFTKTAWSALKGPAPDTGRIAYGVKFTVDGSGVGLASAIRPEDDGPVFVRPIKQANLGEGLDWLVDYLVDRAAGAAQIVIDGKSGVGFLVNALRDAGVRNKRLIIVPRLEQVLAAHSMFEQGVRTGMVSHPGVKAFDAQVTWALKRKIGTAGGFGWDAPAGKTVVTLDAATLALWGAKTTKRRPGRGGQVL